MAEFYPFLFKKRLAKLLIHIFFKLNILVTLLGPIDDNFFESKEEKLYFWVLLWLIFSPSQFIPILSSF